MPFSFVHASDFQLGAPLFGVADLPDELRSRIVDARYAAARRVFDLALAEQVDAVVLAGGVIAASAGPRAMWFFAEQCERLAEAGISVYWSESELSLQRWLQYVPLPDNVSLANPEVGQVYECSRDGNRSAVLLTGKALLRPISAEPETLRIGVVPDATDMTLPETSEVDYWALGGRSHPGAVGVDIGMAQFPGTIQGESPDEQGPRGCVLVHTEDGRHVTSRFVPTAGILWRDECITIDEDADWSSIRGELTERARGLVRASTCDVIMVRWTLRGHGIVWQQLLREEVHTQLLNDLRCEFGRETRPVWSLFVEATADETQLAQWNQDANAVDASTLGIDEDDSVIIFTAGRRGFITAREAAAVDMAHAVGSEPHFQQRHRERVLRHAAAWQPPD